jgi:hypothetical protein
MWTVYVWDNEEQRFCGQTVRESDQYVSGLLDALFQFHQVCFAVRVR